MATSFGGGTAVSIFRPNRGPSSTLGAIKVKGETRDRWFSWKDNRKIKLGNSKASSVD